MEKTNKNEEVFLHKDLQIVKQLFGGVQAKVLLVQKSFGVPMVLKVYSKLSK